MEEVGHYRSKNPFTLLICVIHVNQWQIKLLATVCASSGEAINADFTDSANLIVPVFAGLASCFSTDYKKLKSLFGAVETFIAISNHHRLTGASVVDRNCG